jgi:hypothetical protein
MVRQLPSTSASIVQEPAQHGKAAASSLLDDTSDVPAMTSFTTTPVISSEPPMKPARLQLSSPKEMLGTELESSITLASKPIVQTHEDPCEAEGSIGINSSSKLNSESISE